MDTAGLLSLPVEVLQYLCLFLCEDDLKSLSKCCVRLAYVTKDDRVWARCVTERIRSLETQDQQVSPTFTPDPSKCQALQKLSLKKHLLGNWMNNKCVHYATEHDIDYIYNLVFYKEVYMFIMKDPNNPVEVWDLRAKPQYLFTSSVTFCHRLFVYEDDLVAFSTNNNTVNVFKIDIVDQMLPFNYSFSITGNKSTIEYILEPNDANACLDLWSDGFDAVKVKDLLLFIPNYDSGARSSIHIWNIVDRVKVGAFASPIAETICMHVHSAHYNQVFLEISDSIFTLFYKFDAMTHEFSEIHKCALKTPQSEITCRVLFYKNHCIEITESYHEPQTWRCEITDSTSAVESEKCFVNVSQFVSLEYYSIVVITGRFVIPCLDGFHVVNALNLNTEYIVSHNTRRVNSICPVSVCGTMFLLTVEAESDLTVWDLERKVKVKTLHLGEFYCNGQREFYGFKTYARDYNVEIDQKTWIEEEDASQLYTKIVTVGGRGVTITHFW